MSSESGYGTSILTVRSVLDKLEKLYVEGPPRGISTGIASLDQYFTLPPIGALTCVTGIANRGKSEIIDQILVNLAMREDMGIAIHSPENAPIESHCMKLMEKFLGAPLKSVSSFRFAEALKFVDSHFFFVSQGVDPTVDNILEDTAVVASMGKAQVLVIDPWNVLEHRRLKEQNETEYTAAVLNRMKRFAVNFFVNVILVAHPTKLMKLPDGSYPVPKPGDISGSNHFQNISDFVISIHRPDMMQDITEIHVQKVRHKYYGKIGMTKVKWDRDSGRVTDLYE